ncbi:PAP2-domain-containing protein [Metschnikowia bicuspidata var. bicuspidata NRRL YB-4993]|uniref:PAP2-domain-containing protein n=1 Tax=Metschnikowia bicuspidata var. bicuspidata NRRL YB-4993 TaxID=869754 RepID=A0A1A0HBH0_9ASCO|nr:PAP2-domain-containing protein [Metschnikowia bicuspidata var. bicuspidata NRRL YB-4993]OBA21233.1 PAP2-domain-containing protein [Metschnikowia bicuspidata var. bicuspidata NRRL YB-4993]
MFDRVTFGVQNLTGGPIFIRWRMSDLIYVVILLILYPTLYRIDPFERQFYINDLTILHPFAETERVSNTMLFVYSTWVPLVVIFVMSLAITSRASKLYVTYVSVLGLIISVFTTSIMTDVLKNSFGRHRPDFLARCVPRPDTPKDVLVYAKDVCTTDNAARLMDGFRTTPLGHSSISFAGLFFLSLWLSGQLAVTRPQVGALRWVAVFLPTFGAALIALSRTEDYRHHFVDVFVGLCIGLAVATWLYMRVFPSPWAPDCYEPKLLDVDQPGINYTTVAEV